MQGTPACATITLKKCFQEQLIMTTREFQKKQPLSILFAYFKPHRGLFALDLVCATIVALIDLAFPMVTRKSMYDQLPRALFVE